jgi:hypothetical protein
MCSTATRSLPSQQRNQTFPVIRRVALTASAEIGVTTDARRFSTTCTVNVDVTGASFDQWHFLNLLRTSGAPEEDDCPAAKGCVLTGIARHTTDLRNAATDQERAEALFFLGHWLGDIHQPLHISFSDDQGETSSSRS